MSHRKLRRLDMELVARGLARSRAQAQAMINSGSVRVDGAVARRAASRVGSGAIRAGILSASSAPMW